MGSHHFMEHPYSPHSKYNQYDQLLSSLSTLPPVQIGDYSHFQNYYSYAMNDYVPPPIIADIPPQIILKPATLYDPMYSYYATTTNRNSTEPQMPQKNIEYTNNVNINYMNTNSDGSSELKQEQINYHSYGQYSVSSPPMTSNNSYFMNGYYQNYMNGYTENPNLLYPPPIPAQNDNTNSSEIDLPPLPPL